MSVCSGRSGGSIATSEGKETPEAQESSAVHADCKIVLAYHKPSVILANGVLQPIHVGRQLTDVDLGIPGDDTGANISGKNTHYAELTALYWAWKNLTAPTYVGLFHYRRLLDFSGRQSKPAVDMQITTADEIISRLALDEKSVAARCEGYGIVTRCMEDLHDWSDHSVCSHYASVHSIEHLHVAQEVVRRRYSEYSPLFAKMLSGSTAYFANVVIMRRDLLDAYCTWLFGILGEVERCINLYEARFQKYSQLSRVFGFLAERLTSLFILKCASDGVKVAEYPAVSLVPGGNDRWHQFNTYDLRSYDTGNGRFKWPLPEKPTNTERPAVSVVIPVYNSIDVLGAALESVFSQTLTDIEVIAVDDGSTDGSLDRLKDYERSEPRLRVLAQENGGPGLARNAGLAAAHGHYVHFMDSDDRVEPRFLELLYAKARHYDAEVVLSSHRTIHSETGEVLNRATLPHTVLRDECTNVVANPDLLLVPGHLWDKLFERQFILRFPFCKEGGEDLYVFWRAIASADRVAIAKEVLYEYRVNMQSVQARKEYALGVFETIEMTKRFLKEHPRGACILPYFSLFLRLLIAHVLRRNAENLLEDEEFRHAFFQRSVGVLSEAEPVPGEIVHKGRIWGGDQEWVCRMATMSYEEWWTETLAVMPSGAADGGSRARRHLASCAERVVRLQEAIGRHGAARQESG